MYIEKEYFGGTSVWAAILLEQFQNRFGFEKGYGKTCLFPSQIESSIPTFRDMYETCVEKLFVAIAIMVFTSKIMR